MGLLFKIEPMEALKDCFRTPMPSAVFHPEDSLVTGWPSFHPSKADPDGGYQDHVYRVDFQMEEPRDCTLYVKIYVSTPRLPYLQIQVNNSLGHWYPDPVPSKDPVIRPTHALHASIYSVDEVRLFIPAQAFVPGKNSLHLTAMDDEPVHTVNNSEAVLRLDRMANACGFHYAALRLEHAELNDDETSISLRPGVVYLQTEDGLAEECQLVYVPGKHAEKPAILQLDWDNGSKKLMIQPENRLFGQQRAEFLLGDGAGDVSYHFTGPFSASGSFRRRRKWKVFITPHAHTDIGYTHRQSEVAERMSRNLDTALKLLEGDLKNHFSYVLDSSWSLEDFIQTRGAESLEKILAHAGKGRLGIPANYVDLLTQFASLEELIHNGDFSLELLEPAGLVADRVDIVDVASASWSLPSLLAGMGVRYLLHANNQDRGPFRLNSGLHRKSPFYWQGPDGQSVLTWLARMYCEFKKVCGSPGSLPAAKRGLDMWLKEYEREDYKPDAVILYGQEADNTDLDVSMAAFTKAWEQNIAYPQLVPSNGSSFFEYLLPWSDSFLTITGDQGAYWEDGAASSPVASFKARKAQALLKNAQVLESLAAIYDGAKAWPKAQYDEAWRWLLLYAEHTWGSFLAGMDPEAVLQQDQWAVKANMAQQAVLCAESLLTRAASRLSLRWNNHGRELVVFNPNSFPVEGIVSTEFLPDETVLLSDGSEASWRKTRGGSTLIGADVLIPEVPALSYRRLILVKRKPWHQEGQTDEAAAATEQLLENTFYKVKINTQAAEIISLYDKEQNCELCKGGIGSLLYALGSKDSTLQGNHHKYQVISPKEHRGFEVSHAHLETSSLGQTIKISGHASYGAVTVHFFLPANQKRLDLSYQIDLQSVSYPEALYVDFDFQLPDDTRVLSDSQTTWVDWSRDAMTGACKEWLPLQTSMLLKCENQAVQIASPDAFLFTVGQPVQGLWHSLIEPRGGRVLSFVYNNHWRSNYLSCEKGLVSFRYALTSDKEIPFEKAHRFGWAQRHGLFVQRMSYQEFREDIHPPFDNPAGGQLFCSHSSHINLHTMHGSRKAKGGFVVRLTENAGKAGSISLHHNSLRACQSIDHLERPQGPVQPCQQGQLTVNLSPWQVRSILLFFS